jgi:hypothetical protein
MAATTCPDCDLPGAKLVLGLEARTSETHGTGT